MGKKDLSKKIDPSPNIQDNTFKSVKYCYDTENEKSMIQALSSVLNIEIYNSIVALEHHGIVDIIKLLNDATSSIEHAINLLKKRKIDFDIL